MVSVCSHGGRFVFENYMEMHREPMNLRMTQGKPIFLGHGTAEGGAYTLTFFGASTDYNHVAFHIKQGNLGVVYSRKENGLLRPQKKSGMDEVDFHDYIAEQYGISPLFLSQNRFEKFFSDGLDVYKSKDFTKAAILFNKAAVEGNNIQKYEALFYKAICLHYLRNPEALDIFKEIVASNPSYQSRVFEFMRSSGFRQS